jgi:hypothetical protein
MLKAGWLQRFIFTKGKGWHLVWTQTGAEKALSIKTIILSSSLMELVVKTIAVNALESGEQILVKIRSAVEGDDSFNKTWSQTLKELCLENDIDGMHAFLHIINQWKPGSEADSSSMLSLN